MVENHTPIYGLNQYSGTDSFRYQDFNDDNMRIEAAIKESKEAPAKIKLREFVLEEEATLLYIDLSDLDFTEFDYIHFDAEHNKKILIKIDPQQNIAGVNRCLATTSSGYDDGAGIIAANSNFGRFTMLIHYSSKSCSALTTSDSTYQDIRYGIGRIPWAEAKGLYYKCTLSKETFPVGYKITVWGEK